MPNKSFLQQSLNITSAANYVEDHYVVSFNPIDNDVLARDKTTQTGAQVFITTPSDMGIGGKKKKPVRNGINHAVGSIDAGAFLGDVIPNVVQLGFGRRGKTMRHFSPGRGLLCRKSIPSALLDFSGEIAHGLLRDDAAFAPGKRRFGLIDCDENFRAGPLAFFPQSERFLHRIFLAVKSSAFNSLTDKRFLVRGELHFHSFQGTGKPGPKQTQKLSGGVK